MGMAGGTDPEGRRFPEKGRGEMTKRVVKSAAKKGGKATAKRGETPVLEKILERLRSIDPPVKRLPVEPPDPAMTNFLVPLAEVCYFTTRSDAGREETAVVTTGGKTYYTSLGLDGVAARLKEHPHFLRTSRFYLVNLTLVRGFRFSSARDLWFEGIKEPVINAVTDSYKDVFDTWVNG